MRFASVRWWSRTILVTVAKWPPLAGTLLLLVAASAIGADSSANWPQFSGPGALGVTDHPNLPHGWNTNENVAWKLEVPEPG